MKKIFLALPLVLISTCTLAEWTEVGESATKGGFTAYADLASIHKVSDKAKMWALFDYKTVQKAGGVEFLSERIRREYHCKEKQMRKLAFKLYSWNMEDGQLVRSYSQPQGWEVIQANSIDEAEWKIACGK